MANKSFSKTNVNVKTIQFLRFLAASMVLVAHISFYLHNRVDSNIHILGNVAQGVGLFFVISGFIMVLTGNPLITKKDGARYFIISRLIRIVPLYWTLNLAKLISLTIISSMIMAKTTPLNFILSMLFLPAKNADGIIEAFYGVGWSLNFEMAFYFLFAIALFARYRPAYLLIPILILLTCLSFYKSEDWPAVTYLFAPTLLNFVWGMLIGEWYLSNRRIPTIVSINCILFGFFIIFNSKLFPSYLNFLHFGNALVVFGFVAIEQVIGNKIPKIFLFLGDASYSLYLTHPFIAVFSVVAFHKIFPSLHWPYIFIATIFVSFLFASSVFIYFEKPITIFLRKKFLERKLNIT